MCCLEFEISLEALKVSVSTFFRNVLIGGLYLCTPGYSAWICCRTSGIYRSHWELLPGASWRQVSSCTFFFPILKLKLDFGDQPLQVSVLKIFLECGLLNANTRKVPGIVGWLMQGKFCASEKGPRSEEDVYNSLRYPMPDWVIFVCILYLYLNFTWAHPMKPCESLQWSYSMK